MEPLILYSTVGCHLCELALELAAPILENSNYQLQERDIADSDELMDSYGIRIPVLRRPENGSELNWPFDIDQLQSFLK
jgi:hypothetical protein